VSTEQTQRIIDRYFELMGQDADFTACCTDDVTWLVADTGEVVGGRQPVREYINALHATMADAQTRHLVVGEGSVYLEGDCADPASSDGARLRYCIAYDIAQDQIGAMRCYGPLRAPTGS
jgi:ketosteroid isomerase-like protein